MKYVMLVLIAIIAGVAVCIYVALAIERLSAKPDESKFRRAVDLTCKHNGLKTAAFKFWAATVLMLIAVLFLLLLSRDSSWARIGGTWL